MGPSTGQVDAPSSFDKNAARLTLQNQFTQNVMGYVGILDDVQALGPVLDAQGHQLPSLNTTNVGAARARGAELEMTIVPTEKLLFNVNLGYLDTAYTSIRAGTLFMDASTAFQQAPKNTGT